MNTTALLAIVIAAGVVGAGIGVYMIMNNEGGGSMT
jgi:hypothetical protein